MAMDMRHLLQDEKNPTGMLFDKADTRPKLGADAHEGSAARHLLNKSITPGSDGTSASLLQETSSHGIRVNRPVGKSGHAAALKADASSAGQGETGGAGEAAQVGISRLLQQNRVAGQNIVITKQIGDKAMEGDVQSASNDAYSATYQSAKRLIKGPKSKSSASTSSASASTKGTSAAKASKSGAKAGKVTASKAGGKAATVGKAAGKAGVNAGVKGTGGAAATTAKSGVAATAKGIAGKATTAIAAAVAAPAAGGAAASFGVVAAVGSAVIAVMVVLSVVMNSVIAASQQSAGRGSGLELANFAIAEYDSGVKNGDNHAHGYIDTAHTKAYWQEFMGGYDAWCSCFVGYCWKGVGLDESLGMPPHVPSANTWIADNSGLDGKVFEYTESYRPEPGDIVVQGGNPSSGYSDHVGLVVSELDDRGMFRTIEGNYGDCVGSAWYYPGQLWSWVYRPNFPSKGGGGALMEGVSFNMSERAFVREWAPRIDAYIERVQGTNAPLYGHGECFARSAYRGKMDPRWLPVVSFFESNCGLAAWGTYNCYGWGVTDSGATSVAYSDGYDSMIAFILENASGRGNGWAGSKVLSEYSSLEELDAEYCSSAAGRVQKMKDHMASI